MRLDINLIGAPCAHSTRLGRRCPPDIVAAARTLIEVHGLSRREAAARAGLREDTVGRWARRFGWRRADAAGETGAALATREGVGSGEAHRARDRGACFEAGRGPAPRHEEGGVRSARSGGGRGEPRRPYRYGPEVVAAARGRVEGSRDGVERIALALGVSSGTIYAWARRFGWRRPPPPAPDKPGFYRSRRLGRPYGGDARGTARDLVTGSTLPMRRIAERAGVSRATLFRWAAKNGWTRPRSVAGRRRAHPRYPAAVVAAAGALYRTTRLPTSIIAARVGTTRDRVGTWARLRGWTRPPPRRREPPAGR